MRSINFGSAAKRMGGAENGGVPASAGADADATMQFSSRSDDASAGGLVEVHDKEVGTPGAAGDTLTVEVFDPQHHGRGRKRYTTYCVLVRDVRGGQSRGAVRRHYSAFEWLYRNLNEERPGAAVPILPHKKALKAANRFSEKTVSYHRERGERWLNRVLRHPELCDAQCLAHFLGADDLLFVEESGELSISRHNGDRAGHRGNWLNKGKVGSDDAEENHDDMGFDDDRSYATSTVASTYEADTPLSGKIGGHGERLRKMRQVAKKVSTRLIVASAAELKKSPDEYFFVQLEEWASVAEATVQSVSRETAALKELHSERANTLEEAGSNFAMAAGLSYPLCSMAQSGLLSSIMKKAGESSLNSAILEGRRAASLGEKMDDPIQELLWEVQSFRNALQRRREVQVEYTNRVNRIEGKKETLKSLRASPMRTLKTRAYYEERFAEAERQLEETKEQAAAGKIRFEEGCNRVKWEAEHFQAKLQKDLFEIVRALAKLQMDYNTSAEKGWADLRRFMDLWR